MSKQIKILDRCPRCGSKQLDIYISGGDTVIAYECGSSRIKNGHYVLRSDKCEIAYLKAQIKHEKELARRRSEEWNELKKEFNEIEKEICTLLERILWKRIINHIREKLSKPMPEYGGESLDYERNIISG